MGSNRFPHCKEVFNILLIFLVVLIVLIFMLVNKHM